MLIEITKHKVRAYNHYKQGRQVLAHDGNRLTSRAYDIYLDSIRLGADPCAHDTTYHIYKKGYRHG